VVVTARKKSEALQDVPMSVTALDEARLRDLNVRNLADLAAAVPGLQQQEVAITSQLTLRGVNSGDNNAFEQAVGTYVDGLYRGRMNQQHIGLFDLERIEVLKGPQVTLYGNSAIGRVDQLRLGNLKLEHVRQLIADTLHCSEDSVAPLAALCLEKTQGNPFFLGQLLRALHEKGDIHYQRTEGVWYWNIELIRQRGITDNVVVLMLEKVCMLEPETQNLLALRPTSGTVSICAN